MNERNTIQHYNHENRSLTGADSKEMCLSMAKLELINEIDHSFCGVAYFETNDLPKLASTLRASV